jgi:5-methyltetrahydrofolate--homocysteine methyltransferase
MGLQQDIYQGVVDGDADQVRKLTARAIAEGMVAGHLLNDVLIPAMGEVGDRFERREYFVPQMLVAARAMKAGMSVLRPRLVGEDLKPAGRVVIGTVEGDLHDIGKNLVALLLEGAGFQVRDLGVDVSPQEFLEAVRQESAQVVGMSALLTTTMFNMKSAIEHLREAGVRDELIVMVGGAPVTQRYADEIGADFYAPDASAAVRLAKRALA